MTAKETARRLREIADHVEKHKLKYVAIYSDPIIHDSGVQPQEIGKYYLIEIKLHYDSNRP